MGDTLHLGVSTQESREQGELRRLCTSQTNVGTKKKIVLSSSPRVLKPGTFILSAASPKSLWLKTAGSSRFESSGLRVGREGQQHWISIDSRKNMASRKFVSTSSIYLTSADRWAKSPEWWTTRQSSGRHVLRFPSYRPQRCALRGFSIPLPIVGTPPATQSDTLRGL